METVSASVFFFFPLNTVSIVLSTSFWIQSVKKGEEIRNSLMRNAITQRSIEFDLRRAAVTHAQKLFL